MRKIRLNKKASEWTVSRLVKIILVVVVLVLVIIGITTKGFAPLHERIGGMFDYVLSLIGLGSSPSSGSVSEKNITINGEQGKLIIDSSIPECKVNLPSGGYRLNLINNNLEAYAKIYTVTMPVQFTTIPKIDFWYDSLLERWEWRFSESKSVWSSVDKNSLGVGGPDSRIVYEFINILQGKNKADGEGLFDSKIKEFEAYNSGHTTHKTIAISNDWTNVDNFAFSTDEGEKWKRDLRISLYNKKDNLVLLFPGKEYSSVKLGENGLEADIDSQKYAFGRGYNGFGLGYSVALWDKISGTWKVNVLADDLDRNKDQWKYDLFIAFRDSLRNEKNKLDSNELSLVYDKTEIGQTNNEILLSAMFYSSNLGFQKYGIDRNGVLYYYNKDKWEKIDYDSKVYLSDSVISGTEKLKGIKDALLKECG